MTADAGGSAIGIRHREGSPVPRICPVGVALLVLVGPLLAADPLAQKLDAVMDGKDYKQAHWGMLVVDAKTGETVYARNEERLFTPASVTKLYTCGAAMVGLGAEFTFDTPVYARGEIEKGVLSGDLILVASGDLAFGGRLTKDGKLAFRNGDHTYANGGSGDAELTEGDPLAAVRDLAKQVKQAGVTEVTGEVLVDVRLFARARGTGSGPDAITPMLLNDNALDLTLTGGAKAGDPATVKLTPEISVVQADVLVSTGKADDGTVVRLDQVGPAAYTIRGSVPAGKSVVRILPLTDPAGMARAALIDALRKEGVQVTAATARVAPVDLPPANGYDKLTKLGSHTSAPLGEALKVTLKVSHNLYAGTLPCLLAVKNGKSTLGDGLKQQRKILKDLGVDVATISLSSGAGGDVADAVTPRATVQLLQGLQKRKEWPQFKSWLPELGVDGTLATVVPATSPAKGKAFAKTGTLSWDDALNGRSLLRSKALAGALTTESGRELLFAMFVNDVPLPLGVPTSREGKALGKLCEILHAEVK